MSESKTSPKNKGNKNTEIIVGTAAVKLSQAVKAITEAVIQVSHLDEKMQEGTLKVTDLEDKIGSLKQEFENRATQNKIDLQLQFDADKEGFAMTYLMSKSKVALPLTELNELEAKLETAIRDKDKEVSKAVGIATGKMESDHKNEIALKDLNYQMKEANNLAELAQCRKECTFLEGQVTHWQKALEAERLAGVERAKAGQIGTLNVGAQQR